MTLPAETSDDLLQRLGLLCVMACTLSQQRKEPIVQQNSMIACINWAWFLAILGGMTASGTSTAGGGPQRINSDSNESKLGSSSMLLRMARP